MFGFDCVFKQPSIKHNFIYIRSCQMQSIQPSPLDMSCMIAQMEALFNIFFI